LGGGVDFYFGACYPLILAGPQAWRKQLAELKAALKEQTAAIRKVTRWGPELSWPAAGLTAAYFMHTSRSAAFFKIAKAA
jgi:hypothetical protein